MTYYCRVGSKLYSLILLLMLIGPNAAAAVEHAHICLIQYHVFNLSLAGRKSRLVKISFETEEIFRSVFSLHKFFLLH